MGDDEGSYQLNWYAAVVFMKHQICLTIGQIRAREY